ncbi:unnamed protein product, partial [Brachionus calyciflorus]
MRLRKYIICFLILIVKEIHCGILTPPYFNLVSNKRVTASATCGEGVREPELYCKLTGSSATDRETSNYANLIQGQYCDHCDPNDPFKAHPASFAIDGTDRWWQSPPLSRSLDFNQVNLTIDFGQEFHVAYIYIKMANSPRPGVWALEKSLDNGETYQPWQYFADTPSDCFNFFNKTANERVKSDDDVICTTDFSKVLPVEGGEILVSLVNNRLNSKNFTHSDVLQKWTRATNVRLRLMRTKNLLGHLMAVAKQDPTVTRRYFYSIRDISIGGRCVCNGHAQHCEASNPLSPDKLICRCSHNTCGDQCETCCDGFVQKKWKQNREGQEFECEPCQCYGHSEKCVYDEEVDEKKLSIDIHGNYEGGGVCQECQHNTQGINCQECKPGYYRPFGVPIDSPDACRKCDCDSPYSTGNCGQLHGECECKPQYTGPSCTQCANGYTDWPECKKCDCDIDGRADSSCKLPCNCKFGYLGPFCDKCVDRYYGFPNCTPCDCSREGTLDWTCNKETGQCVCRQGYRGLRCDECDVGYFGDPICVLCDCDVGTVSEVCHKENGTCICASNFAGDRCNECAPGFYNFPLCLACDCDPEGSKGNTCTYFGNQPQCVCKEGRSGPKCDQCAPGYYKYPDCIECQCDDAGSIGQSCDPITGKCNCKSNFDNDKCSECAPDFFNYPFCEKCSCHPKGTADHFPGCNKDLKMEQGIRCPCKETVTGRQCDKCKDRFYGLGTDFEKGCSACECNRNGTLNELDICEQNSGQCQCKLFVDSTACNECKPGFYSLERNDIFGCKSCKCQPGSSVDNNCDRITGQCACLPNIVGINCDEPAAGYYIPDLHQLKFEIEDGVSKDKQVRYGFDESIFPKFSWKGYVHLNKVTGEVSQNVTISKAGTYRMIVRYLNKNSSIAELSIRVKENDSEGDGEVQKASLYLLPNSEPSFETVTVDQINALILELVPAEYTFSFQNLQENLFIDYFVLLPSDYYESTVLTKEVVESCRDYRDPEPCIQYKYPSLEKFSSIAVSNLDSNDANQVDLRAIKEFNLTESLFTAKLNPQNPITQTLNFPNSDNYVLLVDFMNLNDDGQDVQIEISHSDNRRQGGTVYLYKCNLTTLCREVVLSKDYNEPLQIDGRESATVTLRSLNKEILIHQITLVPKNKFDINYIKMSPYCIVKNSKCLPLEYSPFSNSKIELDSDENSIRSSIHRASIEEYIPINNVVHLHSFYPEVTVPVQTTRRDQGEQMLIVHYYQPNHPSVSITVFLDKSTNGTLQANYCPSTSGCRSIVKFNPSSETFSNSDLSSITFQLNENNKDIFIDYVLLASANNVNPDVFKYSPIDLTPDFITKCASQHFNIDYYSNLFCDQSVLALSAKYNDGAQPCNCNQEGSKNIEICNYFGGQCDCKDNVIGRQCNRCKTGYFGFPDCKKCDCPTGNCDDITGECFDPPCSTKSTCNDGCFGFHSMFGCDECNCNLEGTLDRNTTCDKVTGQCLCKQNMDGRKCDKCKAGFYNYPVCNSCDCQEEGSLEQICNPQTGECLCKENIFGDRCENCKPGTFNIESRNSKGCTNCFCFGQTTYCRMSDLYYISHEDLNEWSLSGLRQNSNLSLVDGLKVDFSNHESSEPVYWNVPKSYLGNRVTSYGANIKYTVRVSSGDLGLSVKPDLILSGQNMSLYYSSKNQPQNSVDFENTVSLLEGNFNHLITGASTTRDQLMIVLSSLSEIKLRASYGSKPEESELLSFTFDFAVEFQDNVTGEPALSAEQCYCPQHFAGYSCESCEPGFYKVKGNGPGLFNCVPCQCNGHADTCDQETGECIDCRDNTLGKNCELCKTGFYQISYGYGYTECRLCPCPGPSESNVFSASCMYDQNSNKVYHCNCQEGYAGQFCEHCAPGYYGDPTAPGGKCLPCECNGNIDLTDYGSCDQRTGACLKCLNNTTGINCEKCLDWHYGDPIDEKNCQQCQCNQLGTEICDPINGECTCKKNVVGFNCGSCKENMWGFDQGEGCHECNCDPIGSISQQCDSLTGKCKCKPGVDGDTCNKCASGHWNFTESGCQDCKCKKSLGVKITNDGYECDAKTGHCTCIEGVMGPGCDQCSPRWVLVKHVGCKKCDTCVHTLLDDVSELEMKAHGIQSGNKNSSLTFRAYQKIVKLENDFENIKNSISPSDYETTPLLNLQRQILSVQNDILSLKLMTDVDVNEKVKHLTKILSDSELLNKDLGELRVRIDLLDKLLDEIQNEEIDEDRFISEEKMALYESMRDRVVKRDFMPILDKYRSLLNEFIEVNVTVNQLNENYEMHLKSIDTIKNKTLYIQKSLMEMKLLVDKAKSLEKFKDRDVEFKVYLDNLELIQNETNMLKEQSKNSIQLVTDMITKGNDKLTQSENYLNDLISKIEDLNDIYADHESKYESLRQKCLLAEQKAQTMTQTGLNWKSKFHKSQEGLTAFEMAQVYEKIADDLFKANDRSSQILKNFTNADQQLSDLEKRVDQLKNSASELSQTSNTEIEKKHASELKYTQLNSRYTELDQKSKELSKNLEKIDQWINKTLSSDQTLNNLQSELDAQQLDLAQNEEKSLDLIRRVQSLDTLRGSLSGQNDDEQPSGEQLLKSIETSIENLKLTSPRLNKTVQDLFEQNDFNNELEKISKEIYDLKILIDSTRQVVNDIKVAVNFNETTVLNLRPPMDIYPSLTTTLSLYLKTNEANSPVLLVFNESNPNEYISVYIQQGKPFVQYKLSSEDNEPVVLSTEISINNNEWHKIEFERTARFSKLKIYSDNDYQESSKKSDEFSSVFNIDPNGARIVLGQFPISQIPNDLRTVVNQNNQFKGALDAVKLNGQVLGLWNYASAKNIRGELNRKFVAMNDKEEEIEKSQIEKGVYFLDESFMCKNNTSKLKFSGRNRPQLDVTLRFKTSSPNGLLWLWYKDDRDYYAISLENGHINVVFANGAENKLQLFERSPAQSSYRLNDDKYHTIKVSLSRNLQKSTPELKFSVVERLDQERETLIDEVVHNTNNKYYTLSNGKQCIGGMATTDREKIFKDNLFNSFTGCYVSVSVSLGTSFEELSLNDKLHKPGFKSHNVEPDCPSEINTLNENLAVSFSSLGQNGVLFYRVQDNNKLLLRLKDGHLVLTVYETDNSFSLRSTTKNLNDNKLH